MVTNIYMKCNVCGSVINLKWQVGYIEKAPVSVVCAECRTIIKFDLITNQEDVTLEMTTKNASHIMQEKADFIAETSSELLTYKITRQSNISPGMTPFMRAIDMLGSEGYDSFSENFLKGIGMFKNYSHIYHRINDLYYNGNYNYLKKQLAENMELKVDGKTFSNLEIIENLYMFNIVYYASFFKTNEIGDLNIENLKLMKVLRTEKKNAYEVFLNVYCSDELLKEYDTRIYKSINAILDNYYLFLPATFLDYVDETLHTEILENYTLTTTDFENIRHIYMTIFENLLKVYDIIILLNNILERNDYTSFPNEVLINNKPINTINQFQKLTKGNKMKFLERDSNFDQLMPCFNNKVRNAIGHESWEYKPFEHMIIFQEENGSNVEEMYLLEFAYDCWKLTGKCIAIYKVLQDIKRHRELTINNINSSYGRMGSW